MLSILHSGGLIFINNFIFISIRILSMILFVPIFGHSFVHKKIKCILSIMISIFIIPYVPHVHSNLLFFESILIIMQQIVFGVIFGSLVHLLFFFVIVSGEIIGLQVGLSFINNFDVTAYMDISLISKFLYTYLILMFLFFDGHIWIINFFVESFYVFPINSTIFNFNIFTFFIKNITSVFLNGIMLSLPLIIILLILNILIGVLNCFFKQMSIFSFGFSLFVLSMLLFFFTSHAVFILSIRYLLKDLLQNLFF
ncbi:flagellar biosynthetic protein FliR [Buchnera aphidicola]|uniref:flagellar biosynthetic protein FliR n=1 Tax=Buchnera aphidicola TaxID=9 RepID=UPI003463D55C